jgi:serine/threonine protein kinase
MEMQVLRIIDEQRHDNIIDVVAFYSWRGELNCVFPFVELTLYEVLHENWKPESMAAPARFPEHWLWQQMILVADALQTIHNPPKQLRPDLGIVVGFHFDLKPKNILVTPDGILKITDFGQSMVKMVEEKEYAYGTYIGGDFAYGPPEVAPTRNEIKELVLPPSLQSSRQFPDPPTPPSTTSRNNSTAASHRASYDSRKRSSTKSLHSPSGALPESELVRKESFATSVFGPSSTSSEVPKLTATANYDVWSLACIMTEVLAFIFEGGADAVKNFESLRREEGRDLSFHKGIQDQDCLKDCVRRKFHAFRAVDHPDATFKLGQPGSYLSDVVGLLEDMFVADPARRLSSARVVTKLNTIDANHKEDSDPNTDILHVMRNLRPIEGFTELGYLHNDGIVPFYSMLVFPFICSRTMEPIHGIVLTNQKSGRASNLR